MKLKIFTGLILIAVAAALFAFSQNRREAFAAAEDFPRGALFYVQVADLPAVMRLWKESKFKADYLPSESFDRFKNRHLGLKLASRWEEFNQASGFPIDLETLGGLTETSAAIAVYDIGRLEFVFVAPLREEVFAATKFAIYQNNFKEETLPDGTRIFRAAVAADRGRQKQELLFTNVKNRFILATSEKLLAQTLNNINGANGANRLADEPAFKTLSETIEPRAATVWVNQAALNRDYYFRRYWLMSEIKSLADIRAGIFDLAIEDGKLIERRRLLLDQPINQPPIEAAQATSLLSLLPAAVPFYRLQKADDQAVDETVRATIFDRQKPVENESESEPDFYETGDFQAGDYDRLSDKFNETIDETEAAPETWRRTTTADFATHLRAARPQSVLTFAAVKNLPVPLFAEFRRAAIFALAAPGSFDAAAFEAALEKETFGQLAISVAAVNLDWQTKNENGIAWRELKLPLLNREIVYARRGDFLLLANSADFLREIHATKESDTAAVPDASLNKLTVINFNEKENAFDRVFDRLAEQQAAHGFFTVDVAGLLDSLTAIEKIESRENYSRGFSEQEIIVSWRKSD